MDGAKDLMELARLLRLGSAAALRTGTLQAESDLSRIRELAREAERIAEEIESIAATPPDVAGDVAPN